METPNKLKKITNKKLQRKNFTQSICQTFFQPQSKYKFKQTHGFEAYQAAGRVRPV